MLGAKLEDLKLKDKKLQKPMRLGPMCLMAVRFSLLLGPVSEFLIWNTIRISINLKVAVRA